MRGLIFAAVAMQAMSCESWWNIESWWNMPSTASPPPPPLPPAASAAALKYSRDDVSVSGQSAGGSMAMQHLFIHSDQVIGAGILSGSAYGCGSLPNSDQVCMDGNAEEQDVTRQIAYTVKRHSQRLIADPFNLRRIPIFLFHGRKDDIVLAAVMQAARQSCEHFGDAAKIFVSFETDASHRWVKDSGSGCVCGGAKGYSYGDDGNALRPGGGNPNVCSQVGEFGLDASGIMQYIFYPGLLPAAISPIISPVKLPPIVLQVEYCGLDASGIMLDMFYPGLLPAVESSAVQPLKWIRQGDYFIDELRAKVEHSMLVWAPVYVPAACVGAIATCGLHINYHGCSTVPRSNSPKEWYPRLLWPWNIGLNEYAEANRIVVLYPQTAGDRDGCYNWNGYDNDPFFDTIYGAQARVVTLMANGLPNASLHDSIPRAQPVRLTDARK